MKHLRPDSARISRRHLIRSGAAATLLAASSIAARAEPARHGVLRIAAPEGGPFGRLIAPGSVFDCLTEIGADGRLHGELAEAWEPRDGARVWVLTLRRGVTFHDRRAFGAEDAAASLRHHMGRAPDGLGIASVRKLAPHQVAIALHAPDPGFPFVLADPSLVILPAGEAKTALAAGNGTGLYRVVEQGEAVRLERVAAHYKDGRAGWFEAVELLPITDPEARTGALLSGRVDAVAFPDPSLLPRRRSFEVSVAGGGQLRIAARGADAGALARAVKAGLDRSAVLEAFLGGRGRPAADHPLAGGPAPGADPDRARRILAAAGVDRATLALGPGLRGMPGIGGLVRVLQDFAASAGLRLAAAEAAADLTVTLAPAAPTDDLALRRFPRDGLSEPAVFDRRLAEARVAPDSALREEIQADLARILAEDAYVAAPVFAHATFAHTHRLTHLGHIGALDTLDSARMAERWFYGSFG